MTSNGQHAAQPTAEPDPLSPGVRGLCLRTLQDAPRRALLTLLLEGIETGEIRIAGAPAQYIPKDVSTGRFLKGHPTTPLAGEFWAVCEVGNPTFPWMSS